jgi:LmbE family N-acetylglucosaminyl deacetylase
MPNTLRLHASDRLLYFAPHPDDETLAGGGLIQKAAAMGVPLCIVFLTNGDRNPWPQRVMERSIFLDAKARRGWGVRRQGESRAALDILGAGGAAEVHFIGWPDQGITKLLMAADELALTTIGNFIEEWKPTQIFTPAAEDTHPDHSAFFVMLQLALDRLHARGFETRPTLSYMVHVPKAQLHCDLRSLKLSPAEKALKAEAIQAHETQTLLSRKRFLAYARDTEEFHFAFSPEAKHSHHPVVAGDIARGALQLRLKLLKPALSFRDAKLHVVLETLLEGSLRWTLKMPSKSAKARICDAITGKPVRWASVRISGRNATISLPATSVVPLTRIFVKLEKRPLFFDIAGWREIAVDEARRPKLHFHRHTSAQPRTAGEG